MKTNKKRKQNKTSGASKSAPLEYNGNNLLQSYIEKCHKQTKLAKKAVADNDISTAKYTSSVALEAVVDADIYIHQHKSFVSMNQSLIDQIAKLYDETKVLIKSIYGDERPYISGDSIAGDYFYGSY